MDFTQEYKKWLNSSVLSAEEKAELSAMATDDGAIQLAFGSVLEFGTAGLRAKMGVGTAAMNVYTVSQATQGIAELIKTENGEARGVAIACDSRNNSELFARVSAEVLAANGIRVYIFDGVRPTPELSFAVRECGCIAGINITASHNPKEYNGYKAYWEDGAQISPEQANVVSSFIAKIDVLDGAKRIAFDDGVAMGLITVLDSRFDEIYMDAVLKTAVNPDAVKKVADDLKIVYTPLHGAGHILVPEVLSRVGLRHLYTVPEQMVLDGNFPTVKKPNPEYPDVFTLGIDIANRVGSDLVIATDPDSDRVGVMCRDKDGSFATISGNQMGALLLDYVITAKREQGRLSSSDYAVKSIVSSDMAYRIAEMQGVVLHDVLTGFKFIGEVIKKYEVEKKEGEFLLGFEESYGYLFGSYARDKDAVGATMMIVEMTAFYRARGMTLLAALDELYEKYGYYGEQMIDIYMEGLDGIEKRKNLMKSLREAPPVSFGGCPVERIGDYKAGVFTKVKTGETTPTGLVKSDVLYYTLENGDKIIVRPSGTEPKVKIYVLAHANDKETLKKKIAAYAEEGKKRCSV